MYNLLVLLDKLYKFSLASSSVVPKSTVAAQRVKLFVGFQSNISGNKVCYINYVCKRIFLNKTQNQSSLFYIFVIISHIPFPYVATFLIPWVTLNLKFKKIEFFYFFGIL